MSMEKKAGAASVLAVGELSSECEELLRRLPVEKYWEGTYLYQYHGFWLRSDVVQSTITVQRQFQARDSDIILNSIPKSGTTWLKALIFSVVNRSRFPPSQSPLLTSHPHDLVRSLEVYFHYQKKESLKLEDLPSPRIFATHTPYSLLPASVIKDSGCRIVYVCRNPLDRLISVWHFLGRGSPTEASLEEELEMFCRGVELGGPFWDHVLEFWKASLERPEKVLFLKYEDLKQDPITQLTRIAGFLGCPFSEEEERQGMIEEISNLCSFQTHKNLEVNKSGCRTDIVPIPKSAFFRKGEVGDWANHISPAMAARLTAIIEEKLRGTDLSFNLQGLHN